MFRACLQTSSSSAAHVWARHANRAIRSTGIIPVTRLLPFTHIGKPRSPQISCRAATTPASPKPFAMESTTSADLETVAAEKSEIRSQELQDQDPEVHALAAANGAAETEASRGVKRPADDEEGPDEMQEDGADDSNDVDITTEGDKPLSKNQLRKLKRRKMWEDKREDRKVKRKEKRHNKQERKRMEREAEEAQAAAEGRAPVLNQQHKERDRNPHTKTPVPVTVILDCQYEDYMFEKEQISLASQVTRCYSDNRMAKHPVNLCISSYGGKMRERFEKTLDNHHKSWRGVTFAEEDFVAAAHSAKELMTGPEGGTVIDLLKPSEAGDSLTLAEPDPDAKPKKNAAVPTPEPEPEDVDKSIVYLSADSPYTLERLEPNTSYVVGGIIDRNRHKGLCYKVAREKKVRTAKLPIGEYMVLHDRHVLATNHVVEIMLRWLELGDWGAAFMKVIPTRKGGKLKDDTEEPQTPAEGVGEGSGEVEAVAPSTSTGEAQETGEATGVTTIPKQANGEH